MKTLRFIKKSALLLVCLTLIQCSGNKSGKDVQPSFNPFVSAFTAGTISSKSTIRIEFTSDCQDEVVLMEPVSEKLFDFTPSLKGKTYWIDRRTIEFRPDNPLPQGKKINVRFFLSKLFDTSKDQAVFSFSFSIIAQSLSLHFSSYSPHQTEDLIWNQAEGLIYTADVVDSELLQSVVRAVQDKRNLNIRWQHEPSGRTHRFTIDSLERKEKPATATLSVEAKKIGFPENEELQISLPSLADFSLLEATVVQQPEQHILIRFSDPLKKNQNLDGLIRLENNVGLRFSADGNSVKAYPAARQGGNIKLIIEEGISNILNYKLEKRTEVSLLFEELKPSVRLTGRGVILPNSDGLVFPFEAVNLSAVDLTIIQIYENNVGYFLQANSLEGEYQLRRAGRPVYRQTLRLDSDQSLDLGKWNAFSMDISRLVQLQQGALYRIELSFKRDYSLYNCQDSEIPLKTSTSVISPVEVDDSSWDKPEDYYYYDEYEYEEYDYDWRQRDNPCSPSYFRNNRKVSRNVLASDIGIIAKMGSSRNLNVFVTDLRTTQSLSGVEIEILNYQLQTIGRATTDRNGMAVMTMDNRPFLLVARQGKQRGYLKLDDGSSLSLSRFDVTGQIVQKGIKGFIYGERGVWRPGDSLFLVFMLENRDKSLPENHPVHFELINPLGQIVRQLVKTTSTGGLYNFSTSTPPDAPTGNWFAKIRVGGISFQKTLKIETVKPNRLKINIDLGQKMLLPGPGNIKGSLQVNWLHGAPARNLKASISVNLKEAPTSFPSFRDFAFTDPARSFTSEDLILFEGALNESGTAKIEGEIITEESSPGFLNASFTVRVFEESGDFSIDRFNIPYSPYRSYVGIRTPKGDRQNLLLTDEDHLIEAIVVDGEGKLVNRRNLDVSVYKLQWRWWWDGSSENLASFIGNSYNKPILTRKLDAKDGRGSFSFRINQPEWGRYLIRIVDPISGHASGKIVYVDWPGWAGRSERGDTESATMLNFNLDKEKYRVGEIASITLPTGENGRALVSLESGTRIISAFWVEPAGKETTFNFQVTEEMAPNVYAHITLVQPHSKRNNDLPIRMYGVLPVFVENPGTRLEPEIDLPAILVPEENMSIRVKEKNGKRMHYTLAIVDEGLLDLTRFQTPDPWPAFYAREALGVRTWDLYDYVMGAYGGRIEKLFSIGGDDELIGKDPSQANRFRPMVRFLGPFTLEKGKTATHNILMPRYIGSVRAMVVAGHEGAYGFTEKTVPVRKPLMVLATLPRVLGPEEKVLLPVTVFAMEEAIKNVKVEVKTNEGFRFSGPSEKTISFGKPGDQVVDFELETTPRTGVGSVRVIVTSGREKAEYDIEIAIRNPNVVVTDFLEAVVEPGKDWSVTASPPGIDGSNSVMLELSVLPPMDFGRRLKYLLDYPHGCVEQITSTAFPQLYLGRMMQLNETGIKLTENNIREAIRKIGSFQLPDGGIGYWPGTGQPNDWGTSYAGHFMLEAEAMGYTLPAGFRDRWIRFQRNLARNWNLPRGTRVSPHGWDDLPQAYRLYTLALARSPEMGAMNRMKEMSNISTIARWRLAAAYALAGQSETARQLTLNASPDAESYPGFNPTFGSRERDLAMILETLTLLNEKEKAIPLVRAISEALSADFWMSTQTTAYCLLSMSKFAGTEAVSDGLNAEYSVNQGKSVKAASQLPVFQTDLNLSKKDNFRISVRNSGKGILFARMVLSGIPATGEVREQENNLKMEIAFRDMKGNPIGIKEIPQGTDFYAEIRVANPGILGEYKDLALTQVFPSGWEIQNLRIADFGASLKSDDFSYQDVRDDRVLTYFDLKPGQSRKYVVILNAAYQGRFFLPGPSCEAMYDKRVNARKSGQWIEVVKASD